MSEISVPLSKLPPEQQAIRARCFHPSGEFVEFPKRALEGSIPDRFEKIVEMYPDHVAIKRHDEQITYGQLNRAANRLARAILNKKCQVRKPVVLFFEPSIALIIGYLATLKAGHMALHVDPRASRDRVKLLMNESQASLILTNREHHACASEWAADRTVLLDLGSLNSNLSVENLGLFIAADEYAHVAYTSGSAGRAKGAVKTHRFALHSAMDDTNTYHICAQDRVAVLGAVTIGKPILNTLLNGAAQYPLERGTEILPSLIDWLTDNAVTILVSSPSAFRGLLGKLPDREFCPSLRLICLGAEPLYRSDIEIYRRHFSSACLLVHRYGSNETNTICDYFVDKHSTISSHRVPAGFARDELEILLVNDRGQPVAGDEAGEIVVKSKFPSLGYWQRDELTSDRFRSTSTAPEERLYFAGDVGRLSESGCLELLGRKDTLARLRGVGVDAGEIEANLLRHERVKEAIVELREIAGESALAAYIVPSEKNVPTVVNLRAFLKSALPDFMVPAKFIIHERFSLTPTEKVDRRALPDPGRSRPELETLYTAARTDIETRLEKIWAEVLSLDKVGGDDNFFELGGHSLAAMGVISQVIRAFRLNLSLKALFESPTVAMIAELIERDQGRVANTQDIENLTDGVGNNG